MCKRVKWIEVVVKTRPEKEEIVSHILYEAGAVGLAIEDPQDYVDLSKEKDSWDYFDINAIDLDMDTITLKAYFSESEEVEKIIDFVKERIVKIPQEEEGYPYGELILNSVDDEDFANNWKKYYKPTKIGERIVIKPSWEDYQAGPNEVVVELDPGMAFGTGTHETTSMCIEALEGYLNKGDHIYDIGCGSGILSIVAAKIGAERVVAVDIDPVCVEVSKENIQLNGVEDRVEVFKGDLFEVLEDRVDLIVSNIIAEIIVTMIGDLDRFLKEEGIFITSGIILDKKDLVEKALLENGFKILETKIKGEWVCIIAQK